MGDLLSHAVDIALDLNGKITEVNAMTQTFAPARDVDDAVVMMARFANGSVGSFEASRFAAGSRNRNSFEINGSQGMLRFNLENLNNLEIFDATEPANLQGIRNLLVTGPKHPYAENFWKPGHVIGYEHSFIATLGDFLGALASKEVFHPNFEDALAVQRVLDATQRSADSKSWVELDWQV
jgi:predicted dehydrogenase